MYRLPFMRLQVCCWICNQTGTENRGKVNHDFYVIDDLWTIEYACCVVAFKKRLRISKELES